MKVFAITSLFALSALAASAAPPTSTSSTMQIMERDTPTCFIDGLFSGACNLKCENRGFAKGSCQDGVCTCSHGKRDVGEIEENPHELFARRVQEVHNFQKRWSCQIGSLNIKDFSGFGDTLCSASCADASGGKKDGYCDKNKTCICKA